MMNENSTPLDSEIIRDIASLKQRLAKSFSPPENLSMDYCNHLNRFLPEELA